ncbi:MAG: porin family protein [Bacteroidota bacterium]
MKNNSIRMNILVIITGLLCGHGYAQSAGGRPDTFVYKVTAGMNASRFNENSDSDFSYGQLDNSFRLGFQFGVTVGFVVNKNLSLETGLGFAGKGSSTELGGGDREEKTRMSYLEVPFLARYQFNNTGFNTFAGFQPGYLLSAKAKVEGNVQDNSSRDVKDNFKSFDAAAVLGVGYRFGNNLRLDASYDFGFVNIVDTDTPGFGEIRNRSFKISLGYVFGGANN